MTLPQKNTPAGRSLKTKGLNTRAAILDSAREVFRDPGYDQTSVSEITRRCGVSIGTFYQYFKNKEQIILEPTIGSSPASGTGGRAAAGARSLEERLPGCRLSTIIFPDISISTVSWGNLSDRLRNYRKFRFHRPFLSRLFSPGGRTGPPSSFRSEPDHVRPNRDGLFQYPGLGTKKRSLPTGLVGLLDGGPVSSEESAGPALGTHRAIIGPPSSPGVGRDNLPASEAEAAQGQMTKKALFQAAETVFGQYGFNRAKIFPRSPARRGWPGDLLHPL